MHARAQHPPRGVKGFQHCKLFQKRINYLLSNAWAQLHNSIFSEFQRSHEIFHRPAPFVPLYFPPPPLTRCRGPPPQSPAKPPAI
ncbi:hypothetical protein EVAR_63471_1 [Eumeta japonica]|uniref:Uncharacterized protein n=1 Tax=Eumeta variegata TaxID=151549 RepID=A0A4C1YCZ9_EUMVA|nr:hypothetical protein EVAR_63471_1 [Eumeta japonica]